MVDALSNHDFGFALGCIPKSEDDSQTSHTCGLEFIHPSKFKGWNAEPPLNPLIFRHQPKCVEAKRCATKQSVNFLKSIQERKGKNVESSHTYVVQF